MVFKCKYFVPDASEIVFDRKDPNNEKVLVQVSNQNDRMRQMARDNLRDLNEFSIQLFVITDDKIRGNAAEKIPTSINVGVPMSKRAL